MSLGATVSSHTADLTKMDQVKAMVAEAVECYGRIDVLVNNAGMVVFGQDEDFTAFQDLSGGRRGTSASPSTSRPSST